ncbi:L-2-amino-thiazoline-4-carboxylic acid hydrolase [Chloroflexota bacterium]
MDEQRIKKVSQKFIPNKKSWVERSFYKQYLNILRKNVAKLSLEQKDRVYQELERLAGQLAEENKSMIVDRAAMTHLGMTTLVLASYRVLLPYFKDNESVIDILEDVFAGVGQPWIKIYTRLILKFSRDPFRTMIKVSKKRIENNYGKTFTFEYSGDGQNCFVITTKKCFYYDFFVLNDIPELTRVFCSGDKNWFEQIKPDKHGFQFERPTTLGYGGSECPFKFTRVKYQG